LKDTLIQQFRKYNKINNVVNEFKMKKSIHLICLLTGLLFIACYPSQTVNAQTVAPSHDEELYKDFKTEHVWDAKVKIAGTIMIGESKHGSRRVIPLTGGTFEGPKIKGEVLPGGEDRQLVRPDGDTELHACYLLKTSDGYIIQVNNQALWHNPTNSENKAPYIKSVIDLEAPNDSPYDYLNHAIFLGTLTIPTLKPGEDPYVIIGVYKVL
jgi:hypothetical protein